MALPLSPDNFKVCKNVPTFVLGAGSIATLGNTLQKFQVQNGSSVFFVDHYFKNNSILNFLPRREQDLILFVDTSEEPTTDLIDQLYLRCEDELKGTPQVIVGIGGGSTLDVAKAVSNLFGNPGKAESYQGWDLLKSPGAPKIGVPTLSGTGAESSRTCVMMNHKKRLKLGMNSEFTIFDHLILDPNLTSTVPQNQFFYSGMDTFIHCIESLEGRYRNSIGDAYSREALRLCESVFLSDDMKSPENRESLMVASYLGGCALANSFVGLVHPLSAALSVVLGLHHCVANCIVLNVLDDFYPYWAPKFREMLHKQKIELPTCVTSSLTENQWEDLYLSTIVHEKPIANALGDDFGKILSREKVREIFSRM